MRAHTHLDEVNELVASAVVGDVAAHHLLAHVQVDLAGGAAHVAAGAGQQARKSGSVSARRLALAACERAPPGPRTPPQAHMHTINTNLTTHTMA